MPFLDNNWVNSGYKRDMKPSIDRLDNSRGYSFDNIRLVTFRENYMTYHDDVTENRYVSKKGSGRFESRAIVKITKHGEVVGRYRSVADALREHGKSSNNARISAVLTGSRKYYLSHIWKYAEDLKCN